MKRGVIQRRELLDATLDLGSGPIDLSPYATTGLRVVTIGRPAPVKQTAVF